jgi:uncharacterized OB-fold protein
MPVLRGEERIYFERAAQGELVFQTCESCGARQWYFRTVCVECTGTDLATTRASGRGVVHSFTTLYRAGHPSRSGDVPYTIALIDLDEGVRVFSELADCDPDAARVGLPVTVRFDRVDDDLVLPVFVPAGVGSDAW